MTIIADLRSVEIATALGLLQPFRGKQIFRALHKEGAMTFNDVVTLSKSLREELSTKSSLFSSTVVESLSDGDSVKLGVRLHDAERVECVLLVDREGRRTACLSCQTGCAMGCKFCRTGSLGRGRNLTAGEIVEQFLHLQNRFGSLSNVVFMGMGEPMDNLDAVLRSVALLGDAEGAALSPRRFTVSTCGIVTGIKKMTDLNSRVRLAVSLVCANQVTRESLMPTAQTNSAFELRRAIEYYLNRGGRRVTLEVALLAGVNDDEESVRALAAFTRGLDVMVNVIPWNAIEGFPFRTPGERETTRFLDALGAAGILAVRRYKRGSNVEGACGQLGSRREEPI